MALNRDVRRRVEESRRELDEMAPEDNLGAAQLLRDSKSLLGSDRQRELAEELACEFEGRAALQTARSQSS